MALIGLTSAMRTGNLASGRRAGYRPRRTAPLGYHPNRHLISGSSGFGFGAPHNLASARYAGRTASGFRLRGQAPPRPIVPVQSTGTAAGAGTAPTARAPVRSPLDAEYFQALAENRFRTNNQINALNLRQANARTNLQANLQQLAHQQPLDQLRMEQGANQRGALYSSVYGQQLGNLNYGYATRQNQAQRTFAQLAASIASQKAAAQQAVPLFEQGQYLAAVERAAKAAQADPALGESPAPLTIGAAATAATGGKAPMTAAQKRAWNRAFNRRWLAAHPRRR